MSRASFRFVKSLLVSVGAFLVAAVTFYVMTYATYGPIDYWDAQRADGTTRRLLAWVAFTLVVSVPCAVLLAVPFAAARRWGYERVGRASRHHGVRRSGSRSLIRYVSYINACELRHKFPYTMGNCG